MSRFKPVGRRIYVRKCHTGEKKVDKNGEWHELNGVVVTAKRANYSPYFEILDIANDCKLFRKEDIGKIVRLPIWNETYMRTVVPMKSCAVKEQMFIDGAAPACLIIP